ncbi:MAG TPA: Calx-beta domain-containing protein [Verrucomicrobiota bacterium]|nr:Calx-beta domain-containing protein [Verrucomicrobiota bacterium]
MKQGVFLWIGCLVAVTGLSAGADTSEKTNVRPGAASPALANAELRLNDPRFVVSCCGQALENYGVFAVTVSIYGEVDPAITVSVDFHTEPLTATPEADYQPVSGTLLFAPGVDPRVRSRTFQLPIINDGLVEGLEQFNVVFNNPMGLVLDGLEPLTVSIVDNRNNERWDDERMPLRVDPDFKPAVPFAGRNIYGWNNLPVLPLPDGGIVMATPLWRLNGESGLGIVRLLPDGRLDPSFEPAGVSQLGAFAVQANGQILVAGPPEFTINGRTVQSLARLNADGSLDPRFRVRVPEGNGVAGVAALADGRVLAVLYDWGLIIRLKADGALDPTFEGVNFDPSDRLEVDHAGRILIPYPPPSIVTSGLGRTRADGTLDESFLANWEFNSIEQFILLPDDGLVVRFSSKVRPENVVVMRLTSDGLVDPAFAPIERPKTDSPYLAAATSDGGFVAVEGYLHMVRYDPAGKPDAEFGEPSFTFHVDVWGGSFSLTPAPDGNLLIHGDLDTLSGRPVPGVARFVMNAPNTRVELDENYPVGVWETNGAVALHLIRTGNNTVPFEVRWATGGGNAIAGTDYLPAEGSVTFGVGESEKTVELQLLDNSVPDADRTVRLRFTTAEGKPLPEVEVTILNDELGFVPGGFRALANGRFLVELTGFRGRSGVGVERSRDLRSWDYFERLRDGATLLDLESGSGLPYLYRVVSDD